jgi:hypothetical protein
VKWLVITAFVVIIGCLILSAMYPEDPEDLT